MEGFRELVLGKVVAVEEDAVVFETESVEFVEFRVVAVEPEVIVSVVEVIVAFDGEITVVVFSVESGVEIITVVDCTVEFSVGGVLGVDGSVVFGTIVVLAAGDESVVFNRDVNVVLGDNVIFDVGTVSVLKVLLVGRDVVVVFGEAVVFVGSWVEFRVELAVVVSCVVFTCGVVVVKRLVFKVAVVERLVFKVDVTTVTVESEVNVEAVVVFNSKVGVDKVDVLFDG